MLTEDLLPLRDCFSVPSPSGTNLVSISATYMGGTWIWSGIYGFNE
jgi:hypothetical protein